MLRHFLKNNHIKKLKRYNSMMRFIGNIGGTKSKVENLLDEITKSEMNFKLYKKVWKRFELIMDEEEYNKVISYLNLRGLTISHPMTEMLNNAIIDEQNEKMKDLESKMNKLFGKDAIDTDKSYV